MSSNHDGTSETIQLDSEWVKKEKAKKMASLKKSPAGKKPTVDIVRLKSDNKENEEVKKKREEEEQARIEKLRLEQARIEKLRLERSRKFPMDDLQLILEDKQLGIETCLPPRPALPLAFHPLKSNVMEDILHIYNVLFGDVDYVGITAQDDELPSSPRFSIKQLGYAFLEVERGNSKRAKCLPPLLIHLLTTLLRKLLFISDDNVPKKDQTSDNNREVGAIDKIVARQKADFESLSDALSPSSCGEIVRLYMELMDRLAIERYPSGYLQEEDEYGDSLNTSNGFHRTANSFFFGYLGPPTGTLHTAVKKLESYDLWCLDAEDIACLLKALCDDLLNRKGCIANSFSKR